LCPIGGAGRGQVHKIYDRDQQDETSYADHHIDKSYIACRAKSVSNRHVVCHGTRMQMNIPYGLQEKTPISLLGNKVLVVHTKLFKCSGCMPVAKMMKLRLKCTNVGTRPNLDIGNYLRPY